MLPLPIDQRYHINEMTIITDKLLELLQNGKYVVEKLLGNCYRQNG
jgi:hypothetical protein